MQIFFLNHFESRKNDIFSFWACFTFLGFIVSLGFFYFRFSLMSESKDQEIELNDTGRGFLFD